MKKGKLFVLPFLAMAIGTLSSCTKDDIKALQDKDIDFLIRHSLKEANPLYPVPKEFTKKELREIINQANR